MSNFETLNSSRADNPIDGEKTLMLDFDGTIVDSLDEFNRALAKILGREPAGPEELEYIRGLSLDQMQEHLGVTPWRKIQLLLKIRQEMASRMDRIEMFDGMNTVMKDVHESGNGIYIVSSNSTSLIEDAINKHGVGSYVTQVHGGVSLLGKASRLRQIHRSEKLDRDNTLYVGDEERDFKATRKIGMECILAAWGFTTLEALEALNPGAIALTPAHLGEQLKARGFILAA